MNTKATVFEEETNSAPGNSRAKRKRNYAFYIPKRLIVTILMGLGMLLVYAMRTNVGVTVVMILDERAYEKVGTLHAAFNIPNVDWDTGKVGFLHSVFYIGFLISQIPGAFFTTVLPSHKLYGGCILISALLNLLLPICIDNGEYSLVCVVRCCQGLSEGMLYPACYGVLRHWTAPSERSRQVSAVLSGENTHKPSVIWQHFSIKMKKHDLPTNAESAYAGAIIGFPMAGFITHYLGWQYVFYASGSLCIIWCLPWICLSYEKPSHHASISKSEFEFMERSQGQDVIDYENVHVPWIHIMTSLPVISICLCHFVRQWVLGLMLTNEPLYLNEFGFNIAETGAYSSLPHIAKVVLSFASGYIADCLLNSGLLSTTAVRKLLTCLGLGIQATGFFVLIFVHSGTNVVIVLTIAVGAFGLTTSGWSVNHYDLSTRYASSIVAVTSAVGSVGAIIVPLVTGNFTAQQTIESWDNVFYLTSCIVAVAAIFYLMFGSGEQQPWANPPAHICLVQKTDPLARKPYGTYQVQGNSTSTKTEDQNDHSDHVKHTTDTDKDGIKEQTKGYGSNLDEISTSEDLHTATESHTHATYN